MAAVEAPLLEVRSLAVRVDGEHPYDIVRDVDLTLASGDVLGLVGESGSGKTTLALALMGFARPGTTITGSVRAGGTEVVAATEAERRRVRGRIVSYVPQDPGTALNPAFRIGTQLVEVLASTRRSRRRLDRTRILELLAKVRLPATEEFLHRYPHQLSGGQLQRVTIAMAMLNRPKVIVFDEPTTGLDVTTQSHVLDTIREVIEGEGTAAVYVTHDLAVVDSIATRVGVMYSGLLVEEAATGEVLARSAHPYTRRLVLATPSLAERRVLTGIPGTALAPRDRGIGCPFAPRCEFAEHLCREVMPELLVVDGEHRARCHRSNVVLEAADATTSSSHDERSAWQVRPERVPPLLRVAGLHASYGVHKILTNIDIAVAEGECTALVGESGSGKTTLARCVSGIHPAEVEGYLEFAGDRMAWSSKDRSQTSRQEIQYIFQNPHASLNPRHTIGHSIAQPLLTFGIGRGAGERRERVRALLERVALPAAYEHRYPSQLSGGERQRVAIARALAAEPRLLVCDEITSSLDVSIQASILELLGELRQRSNLTMLFITHHLGLVHAIADQIVILNKGVVVEQGPAAAVLDAPTDPYTIEMMSSSPVVDAAAAASR